MSLTSQELENLSDLLLSVNDTNTEIAFGILEGQATFPMELLTDVFVVYKITENESLKEKAFDFLKHHLNLKVLTVDIRLTPKGKSLLSEKTINRNIQEYEEYSEFVLDGNKMGLAMYHKYQLGLNYLLNNLPDDLKKRLFKTFIRGTSFSLPNCELTKIPDLLYEFTDLKEIDLSNNKIKTIPAKIKKFTKLESLDISNNHLATINKAITSLNLKKLNIASNRFNGFPEIICQLHSLEYLNLSNLHILFLGETLKIPSEFYQLKKLKELSFCEKNYGISQGIAIHFSDYPNFSKITHPTALELEPLKLAEYVYEQNGNSEGVLYLFANSQNDKIIHKIIEEQFYKEQTKTFDLKGTMLLKFPKEIVNYEIENLDLGDCHLGIPFYLNTDKVNRRTIALNKSELEEKFELFHQFENIKNLNLSDNRFISVPTAFLNENVITLNLSDNQLSKLPDEIEKLENLEELNLGYNDFRKFPIQLTKLKKLRKLILKNNQLDNISKELGELENLEELYLNNSCESKYIDDHFFEIPKSFKKLKKLKVFHFHDNEMGFGLSKLSTKEVKVRQYYQEELEKVLPKDCEIKLDY